MNGRTARRAPAQRKGRAPAASGLGPREAAAEIVHAVCEERRPMGEVLERADIGGLEPRDAALARAIARTTVRRLGDIDWCLATLMARPLPKKAAAARTVLRLSAAQLLFMRQADHAAVNVAVSLLKRDASTGGFAGLANAVLRRLSRERDGLIARLPAEANTPPWLWRRWVRQYGEAATKAMAAIHREEPPIDLAFADPDAPLPEGALRLTTGGARVAAGEVAQMEGFGEGHWWVQDVAAQLPVMLFGDVAGRRVLDMCAAPGGKTMQLAAAGAQVTALEVDGARAERLRENLARTGLAPRVSVTVGDARAAEGEYDAVLLDAPCTSTGTLRRQPDVAWLKGEGDIASVAAIQRDLLARAAAVVRPGGTIVYATCSLEAEEGEAQRDFACRTLGLEVLPVSGPAAAYPAEGGGVRTLPFMSAADGVAGMDGFFAVALRKP